MGTSWKNIPRPLLKANLERSGHRFHVLKMFPVPLPLFLDVSNNRIGINYNGTS